VSNAQIFLVYFLWLLAPAIQLAIVVVMVRKNLRRTHPYFFTYTQFWVIATTVQFCVYHWAKWMYSSVYWMNIALSTILGFAVLYELFGKVVRTHEHAHALRGVVQRWVPWTLMVAGIAMVPNLRGNIKDSAWIVTALSVLVGFAMIFELFDAATHPDENGGSAIRLTIRISALLGVLLFTVLTLVDTSKILTPLNGIVSALGRSTRFAQFAIMLFVLFSPTGLAAKRKDLAYGIALGFGVFAFVDLISYSSYFMTPQWRLTISLVSSASYNVSTILWLTYVILTPKYVPVEKEESLGQEILATA
jgi:hypothetical protein